MGVTWTDYFSSVYSVHRIIRIFIGIHVTSQNSMVEIQIPSSFQVYGFKDYSIKASN
jgi:hypothetical protein